MGVRVDLAGGAVHRQHLHLHPEYPLPLQGAEGAPDDAVLAPPLEPLVDAVPLAELPGERPPLAPVLGYVEDGPHEFVVVYLHVPPLDGEVLLDLCKLFAREFHVEIIEYLLRCVNRL